jgi:hypothetical protein
MAYLYEKTPPGKPGKSLRARNRHDKNAMTATKNTDVKLIEN